MRTPLLAFAALLVAAAPAAAQPTTRDHRTHPPAHSPPPAQVAPPPRAYQFDSRGLILLGEKPLLRRGGRERLDVPPNIGRRFDRLTLVVANGDVDLGRAIVRYADRSRYDYPGRHQFRPGGGESVAIDLPNDQREIDAIEVAYRAPHPQRGTTLQVWGRPRPAPPRPTPARWDNRGWTLIGEQWIEGRADRIRLRPERGDAYTRLMLVVEESDLELRDLQVTFANRDRFSPSLKQYFREGERTRAIDLPAGARAIRSIDLRAANLPGGGRAKVAVWGLSPAPVPTPPPPPPPSSPGYTPTWNTDGWYELGRSTLSDRGSRASLTARDNLAELNKITFAVEGGEARVTQVKVLLSNGQSHVMLPLNGIYGPATRVRETKIVRGREARITGVEVIYDSARGNPTFSFWGR